jgi:hypothetical protein
MSESHAQFSLSRERRCSAHPLTKMKYAAVRFTQSVLVALALRAVPAVPQEQARTQSVELFGGEQFGDNLTDAPVSSRTPRLNDDAVAGARYNYNFTDMWGIQLSSGYSWSRAARVAALPCRGRVIGRFVTRGIGVLVTPRRANRHSARLGGAR